MAGGEPLSYIASLPIQAEEANKLRQLGADTPQQLLAQIRAAPAAFAHYLGHEAARRVEHALDAMVPQDEPTKPIAPPGHLGVPLGAPPTGLSASRVDLARRDRLFGRIQQLKSQQASTEEIEAAERELDALFERSQ